LKTGHFGTPAQPSLQPPKRRPALWWIRWVPAAIFILIIFELLFIVGSVVVVPVLVSFALAYLLHPISSYFEKRGVPHSMSPFFTLLLVTLTFIVFLLFVIPDLWQESLIAGQKIAAYFTPENAVRYRASIRHYSPMLDNLIGERIEQFFRQPSDVIGSPSTWFAGGLSNFLATAVASFDIFLVPFFVYYLLVDFRAWRDASEDLIPPRFRQTFSRLFDEVGRILQSYVRGQLLIAVMMGALYAVGFLPLSVPAWAGIATLAGLLNLVPYIGTLFGLILATIFTLADGGGFWRVTGVICLFGIVQAIEGYYLTPKILGERLRLHPMAVLLGILVGGKLFGLLGIVLAVPSLAVAKVFLMFLRELYKGSYFYHKGDISPHEAPNEILEERLAEAADSVLIEQIKADSDDEVLAVDEKDNPLAAKSV
jgi:predicted PurR-regulated permease PerM